MKPSILQDFLVHTLILIHYLIHYLIQCTLLPVIVHLLEPVVL